MSMADELADIHAAETPEIGVVDPADIGGEPEKALSLRDQIKSSVKEVGEAEVRARDPKGKFAPKVSAEPAAIDIPPTEQNVQPEAPKPAGPPSSWSKESQAIWENLPPQVKADAIKREAEVAKGFDEYRTKTAQFQEISKALDPIRPLLQQNGIQSDAQAVKTLLEWENGFRNPQTRIQAFHQLAERYGVDLSSLAQRSDQSSVPGQEIPEHLRPVLDNIGQLSQTVTSLESRIQMQDQQKIASDLAAFAKDKPHFEKVRAAMGQLMQAGLAKPGDLDGAYQQAVWADPELREAMLREQDEKRKAEFAKTAASQSSRARLAAVSPAPRARQGAPVPNGADKSKGVRGGILAAISELTEDQRA